jgi:uncharacterized protein
MSWPARIVLALILFSILGGITFTGIMARGALGWVLYVFMLPFWTTFPMPLFGVQAGWVMLGVHVIGFPIARALLARTDWYRRVSRFGASGSAGSSSGGIAVSSGDSSSGSSSSSGSGSGGDFSGGGGSSGGGGASGSW